MKKNSKVLSCEDLSVGYLSSNPILVDVSLVFNTSDAACITGPNGSGKTTLVRTLASLLAPLAGRVNIEPNVTISMVPQHNKIKTTFPLTVEDLISMPLERGVPFTKKILFSEDQMEILGESGIFSIRKQLIRECSGGQIQKILLLRSIFSPARLIFLDEPLDALDKNAKDYFSALINKEKKKGRVFIIISHNIDRPVREVFTRILEVKGSKVREV